MSSSITKPDIWCDACHTVPELINHFIRGNQRQFSENIYSEDDLRSSIFGTFVVKSLACPPLLGFLTDFYPIKVTCNFRKPFFWLKFSKR